MIADFSALAPRPPQAFLSDSCSPLFPNPIPVFPYLLNLNAPNALGRSFECHHHENRIFIPKTVNRLFFVLISNSHIEVPPAGEEVPGTDIAGRARAGNRAGHDQSAPERFPRGREDHRGQCWHLLFPGDGDVGYRKVEAHTAARAGARGSPAGGTDVLYRHRVRAFQGTGQSRGA